MSSASTINCPYKKQAKHNEFFHKNTCDHFPEDFYDWKITTLFYVAIHYVKALANQLNIDIGQDHYSIKGNIKYQDSSSKYPKMAFNKKAYGYYDYLYRTSQISRYNGFINKSNFFVDDATFQNIMKDEHSQFVAALDKVKNTSSNREAYQNR